MIFRKRSITAAAIVRLFCPFALVLALCGAVSPPVDVPITITPGSSTPFTPVHKYFMSPTGSDSNNGLTAGSPWLTPNHNVTCGDVIVAAAGTYTTQLGAFGTVSGCPSTTGGIDGTGGIYFATVMCGGVDLEACLINGGVEIDTRSNWAVEGFKCNGGGTTRCFEERNCTAGVITHDGAFINNIGYNSTDSFDMVNDCGDPSHSPTGSTMDYAFGIGNIAQNGSQDEICLAAIDWIALGNSDAGAGTHAYLYGNFSYNNVQVGSCSSMDSESFMFDTLDAHNFQGQTVFANNVAWKAMRFGLQVFNQHFNANNPTIKIYNNTFYADLSNTFGDFADGDVNFNGGGSTSTWPTTLQRNIALTSGATSLNSSTPIFALLIGGGVWSAITNGGTGNENIWKGNRTDCGGMGLCDSGFNEAMDTGNPVGTNFYENPAFQNTADLLANWMGPPTCHFTNTTACMGWNANTQTLTPLTPISDLTATSTHSAGKGYQLPSTTCAANADYPTRLKGIVYLHSPDGGTTINEYPDLVTKPCGL